MKKYLCLLLLSLYTSSFAQITYHNPVIPGFYPDPSVCRVGDNYYLVNSSFGYFPGVPIFQSKDLVNWQQVGYVLNRKEQVDLEHAKVTLGIFAPTIRYHDGVFYMITTNITSKGNFYVTAKDPAGKWSDPIWIEMPGIDPSLFFDDDGKVYVTGAVNWGPEKKGIQLAELDIKTGTLLASPKSIWFGTGGRYPEGPHIYKKDGWYYLMIAEGGTEYGHKVTIARSKKVDGPYIANPANPILTHINMNAEANPIQGVGHADLVQATDSSWWMVALGFRPVSGHHILGRETMLAPVRWGKNEWPVVNGDGTVSLDMEAPTLPLHPFPKPNTKDDFDSSQLGMEWNYLNNPIESNYSLSERKGYLRLKGNDSSLSQLPYATFVGRRQQHFDFTATAAIDFSPAKDNEEAGMTVFMNESYHYNLAIRKQGSKRVLQLVYQVGSIHHIEKEIPVSDGPVQLRLVGSPGYYRFSFSQNNKTFTEIGKADTHFLSSETVGGFTGVYIGLYATGNGNKSQSAADFDWFTYEPD